MGLAVCRQADSMCLAASPLCDGDGDGTEPWGPSEVTGPEDASSLGAFIKKAPKDSLPCSSSEDMAERHHS